jgi:hypothetical protein
MNTPWSTPEQDVQQTTPTSSETVITPTPEPQKSTPVSYASYSGWWSTRSVGGVNYATYTNIQSDDVTVDIWWVSYARYSWSQLPTTAPETQQVLQWVEYPPQKLQEIIDLLGILEVSKTLIPEIIQRAKTKWWWWPDLVQTGAASVIKKSAQEWLDKNKSVDGKSSIVAKFGWFLVKNIEVLLELYNGKEMVAKANPLWLSTGKKLQVFAWHGLDGVLSKLWIVWQAADFFFNSSLKSVSALESQIKAHQQTLKSYGVPQSYIDEPNTWLTYYKDLQIKLHQS